MELHKMYQISTLQALALGYTRKVTTVGELARHGDTGLGTFENVDGEMIVVDGTVYRAKNDGTISIPEPSTGVPFASVAFVDSARQEKCESIPSLDELKKFLDVKIEETFGLNQMHIVRIDGVFPHVDARSESGLRTAHVDLKDILKVTGSDFHFDNVEGTMVCIYYPDYMDSINAAGWHLHFISKDRKIGGHVFDLSLERATCIFNQIHQIEIELPKEPAFDTYALKEVSSGDIKAVEQSKK